MIKRVSEDFPKVSIFGLGYVGAVSAACLVNDGFEVVGVDPDGFKVDTINSGKAPIFEPKLEQLINEGHKSGKLTATHDFHRAVMETDISFCCTGTPSMENGALDTSYVRLVSEQIGEALKEKTGRHVVVMRSTILPGTVESEVIPALEKASGKKVGTDIGLAYYPEFLREGTAISDYYEPGAIVFGQYEDDETSIKLLRTLCGAVDVEPHVISIRDAEIVKYTNNCWHAVKISFANEIGNLCKAANIDSHVVMDVLCADQRLNISRAYMKPGFAYGGSCLPKDLRALRHFGKTRNVSTPVLDAAVEANEYQLERAFSMVNRNGIQRVGIMGLTFKPDTDDLRESPLVILAERLMAKGHRLSIFDPNVDSKNNGGRNFIPHLSEFIKNSPKEVADVADTIIIGIKSDEIRDAVNNSRAGTKIVDLVRMPIDVPEGVHYEGLVW